MSRKASYIRLVAAVLLVLIGGILLLGLNRQDRLPKVVFQPASPPPGFQHAGSSTRGSEDEGFLTREERFARQTRPGRLAMVVATTSYRVRLINPNLEGRLSGEVYDHVGRKPQTRRVTVRGHDGVLEVFPRGPEGSRVRVLTWIERPGVYIQVSGVDVAEQELLQTADSLREQ